MLMDILAREGLERVDQPEVTFDPAVHDAVAHADGEGGPEGQTLVDEVMRSGYRWKGQVLRPAMVRVRG
jgi:molecular chaperone GrpE